MKTLREKLVALGLTNDQLNGVVEIVTEGLTFDLTADKFTLTTKDLAIASNMPKALTVCDFDIHIEGIHPNQVRSLTLPKFDCSSLELFTMQVELFPLSFATETADYLAGESDGK